MGANKAKAASTKKAAAKLHAGRPPCNASHPANHANEDAEAQPGVSRHTDDRAFGVCAEAESVNRIHTRRLSGGQPRTEDHGSDPVYCGHGKLPRIEPGAVDAQQDVKRRDRLRHRAGEHAGEQDAASHAHSHAEAAEHTRFAQKQAAHFPARSADGAQDADLHAPPRHGSRDGVVDEEDADEQRDHAQRGEVELESRKHAFDLVTSLAGWLGMQIWWQYAVELRGDRRGAARVVEQQLQGGEMALPAKEFLRPADVHDREICGHRAGLVSMIEEGGHRRGLAFAVDQQAQVVAELEVVPRGKIRVHGELSAFTHPAFERRTAPLLPDVEGAEGVAAEQIHAEDVQVFAGPVGKGDLALDEAGDGFHAGLAREHGPERFIHIAAHFELRLARNEIDAGGEGAMRAVVGNLDRQVDRHPQRHAEHIQRCQQRVPPEMAHDVPEEDARELAGHGAAMNLR